MIDAIALHELLEHLPHLQVHGSTHQSITGLAYDSRQVQPGSLFVAIKGYHTDGHSYIPQALERGAVALVVDARHWQAATVPEGTTLVIVPDSRLTLAPLAAACHRFPARSLGMVGVTGTKGKTTTTALISQVLESGSHSTGLINSVDFKVGSRQWPNTTRQSTPEAPDIQALLHEMVQAGCTHAVIEATSHALSERWNRVGKCCFDVAVFTNLSHEHLDYHGTLEQYRRDKARLFQMLGERPGAAGGAVARAKTQKFAIVNADDPQHQYFLAAAPQHAARLTYAIETAADIRAEDIETSASGSHMQVATPWGRTSLHLRLPGSFNVQNALAALTVALTQGVLLEEAAAALGTIHGVRGRMQPIDQGQPFTLIVDYAHNPDSFTQVMRMLRPTVKGRMLAVFGSAGERDREKRPLQGAIAAQWCDLLILTDEDPRAEDRERILAEIAAGAEQAGKHQGSGYLLIPDRRSAIRAACEQARPGDVVLLLGKGHETSIEYADGKHPWDEAAEARAALHALGWQNTPKG